MIPSSDAIPVELFVIVSAKGKIVADLGNGDPLSRTEAEEGAAFLDNSEPDFVGPHSVVRFVPSRTIPSQEAL